MAEPATTTPTAAPERDALLATKLHLPRPRPGLVARPRLLQRLTEGMGRELVLVCTPAGFGKTTLLAEWARAGRRPVAWLSLDEADNDPARFWRHVAAALDPVRPGVAERVTALLGSPPASFEGPVTALVNELAELAEEVVLVLDDYHLIQAPAVHASVEFLLQHLPPSLRLVLASRADPPLPLARLRASGQLAELREADLRFTAQEAGELLGATVGAELPEVAVAALGNRTEGWAAGLQLAALSLQGRSDIGEFVEGFSGSHRYVLDYLAEEVLDRQPPAAADLPVGNLGAGAAVRSAVRSGDRPGRQPGSCWSRSSGPTCSLSPLDDVRGWWRYHHLFADLLRARLQQQRPERVPELHRAAAGWCERHGLVDDAIRHARAAGDLPWAARLVEQHFEAVLGRREDATLRRWLELLPAEVVRSRPRLCLLQAFWALIGSRVEAVERLLDAAERAFTDAGDEPYEPAVGRAASLVANIPAAIARLRAGVAHLRGDAEQTIAFARRALAELDEGEWMLESVTRWQLVGAEWLRGRPAEAERGFLSARSSLAAWRATGQLTLVAWGYDHLGQAQRAQGRLSAALGDLPGGAGGGGRGAGPTGHAGRRHRPCRPGRGGLRTRRAGRRPRARHPGRRPGQAARLDPAAGGRPDHPGPDPPGPGRPGRRPGGDPRGRTGPAQRGGGRPAQPRAGGAGPAGPGQRPGRGRRPLGPAARPRRPTTSQATRASASTWSWRGCCSPSRHPNGHSELLERVDGPGRGPGADREHHRAPGAPGTGPCRPRRRTGRADHPGRGARPGRPRGLPAGVRRRGRPRWPPCSASCWQAGIQSGRRLSTPSPATTWPAWRPRSSKPARPSSPPPSAAPSWSRGWSRR